MSTKIEPYQVNNLRRAGEIEGRRLRFRLAAILAVLVAAFFLVFASPLFYVKDVEVRGNSIVSTDTVKGITQLDTSVSIFSFFSSSIEKRLMSETYIKYANVKKVYPDTVEISITERTPCAYVKTKNQESYILIDGDGMVLEFTQVTKLELPIVIGIDYNSFTVGSYLDTDSAAYDSIVLLSRVLAKYEIANVVNIDVSKPEDIHLIVRNIDVYFGSIDDMDNKVQYLRGILQELSEDEKGFLHLEDTGTDPYFSRLK